MLDAVSTGPLPSPELAGAEHRFLLHDVPWWTYVALRDALDGPAVRMTRAARAARVAAASPERPPDLPVRREHRQ